MHTRHTRQFSWAAVTIPALTFSPRIALAALVFLGLLSLAHHLLVLCGARTLPASRAQAYLETIRAVLTRQKNRHGDRGRRRTTAASLDTQPSPATPAPCGPGAVEPDPDEPKAS